MQHRAVRRQPHTPTDEIDPRSSRTNPGAGRAHSETSCAGAPRTRHTRSSPIGERTSRIEGSFRRVTVEQLTLAWWLYQSGHITRRQHRVYMAAHELAEQRRYMRTDKPGRKPRYTVEEFATLICGQGSEQAIRELRGDMRRLARIGLVMIAAHEISFAACADEITLIEVKGAGEGDDGLGGLRAMLDAMPNPRRSVPVPRRLLRAMAAGFSRGVMALITAVLIRGLYWHKETSDYRTDGRYKLSWVAKHFGIGRRTATEARNTLIELGWLEPLEVAQWEMNRWGLRDRIVPGWSHTHKDKDKENDNAQEEAGEGGESATPGHENEAGSASPVLTDSLPLPGNDSPTRTLRHARNRPGVSRSSTREGRQSRRRVSGGREGSGGSREAKIPGNNTPPNIRDIRSGDLSDATRLLELHRQACALRLASSSEAGRLAFMALAQRARSRGSKPGAMLAWLLRERKHAFITLSDEDQAGRMLREHLHGDQTQDPDRQRWGGTVRPVVPNEFSEQERTVAACLRVSKSRRIADPYTLARQTKGWSREQWETALDGFNAKQFERMRAHSPDMHEDMM